LIYERAQTCLTQINARVDEASRRMNTRYLVVVPAVAAMLVAATAVATDSDVADKKRKSYEKSHAVSQVNDCGNGPPPDGAGLTTEPTGPIDVWCQNTASLLLNCLRPLT
jgi:uncharacterized membrane protein